MAPLIGLIGPTGAGKGVQGKLLAESLGGVHLSGGDLLRASGDPAIEVAMSKGDLAPTESVERIVGAAIAAIPQDQAIVMDGFPRNMDEADWMEPLLAGINRPLGKIINLVISRSESSERLGNRGRADDTEAAIERKWQEYENQTLPVLDRYRTLGIAVDVDGTGTVEQVAARIRQAV